MLNKWHKVWLLALLTLLFSVTTGRANPFIIVDSSYEGNGWFRYEVHFPVDPFWDSCHVGTFSINGFGSVEQMVLPPSWSANSSSGSLNFNFTGANQVRPSSHVIRVKSPHQYCKREPFAFVCLFSLFPKGWVGALLGIVTNIAGFGAFDGLIPSATPTEAPAATPYLRSSFSIIPDVRIEKLYITDNVISGLKYSTCNYFSATYQLEGSSDLQNWNYIASLYSSDKTNTFVSPVLNGTGPFYRILMSSADNPFLLLPPPSPASSPALRDRVPATITLKDGQKIISFASKESVSYTIELLDLDKAKVLKSISYQATGSSSAIPVPADWSDNLLLVRVRKDQTTAQ